MGQTPMPIHQSDTQSVRRRNRRFGGGYKLRVMIRYGLAITEWSPMAGIRPIQPWVPSTGGFTSVDTAKNLSARLCSPIILRTSVSKLTGRRGCIRTAKSAIRIPP